MKHIILLTLLTVALCGCSDDKYQASVDAGQSVDIIGLRAQIQGLEKMVIEQSSEIAKLRADQAKQNDSIWTALVMQQQLDSRLLTLVTNSAMTAQKQINQLNQVKTTQPTARSR